MKMERAAIHTELALSQAKQAHNDIEPIIESLSIRRRRMSSQILMDWDLIRD